MKLAYVAGPYRAPGFPDNIYGTMQNIRAAESVAVELWRMGYAVICPHKNTAFFDGAVDGPETWLEGDIVMLKRCDLVVMCPGWDTSTGATNERRVAIEEGIPVYEWPGQRHALLPPA